MHNEVASRLMAKKVDVITATLMADNTLHLFIFDLIKLFFNKKKARKL